MIRESELEEVRKEVEKVATTDIGHEIEQSVDPKGELQASLQAPDLRDAAADPGDASGPTAGEAVIAPAQIAAPEVAQAKEPESAVAGVQKPEKTQTAA
jgi:hypothetical protein